MKHLNLVRFGVSLESGLLQEFDRIIKEKRYPNRSKALSDLIRQHITEKAWNENRKVFGVITMVYDHHRRMLVNKLLKIQHDFHDSVISSQHLHIRHDACLEIIAVKGRGGHIKELFDELKSQKGVLHAAFTESVSA